MAGEKKFKAANWTGSPFDHNTTEASFNTSTQSGLEAWIFWHYLESAIDANGKFKGLSWLKQYLFSRGSPHSKKVLKAAVQPLIHRDHKYSLAHTEKIARCLQEDRRAENRITHSTSGSSASDSDFSNHHVPITHSLDSACEAPNILASKMDGISLSKKSDGCEISPGQVEIYDTTIDNSYQASDVRFDNSSIETGIAFNYNSETVDLLSSDESGDDENEDRPAGDEIGRIQYAPLLDAGIISGDAQSRIPQYGLIGSHSESGQTKSKLFMNTNIPFSIFLCGVQGSGKSHTTSCILENALVPSKSLGQLSNPLSALVFSYGHFSGDGVGFSISEAAFLASPGPSSPPWACVKKIHVLVSPTNFARISKLYLQLPNISVTAFRLKPQNLDIETMLTLMNVSESDGTPLYMAQITQILRGMATTGKPFNYRTFKLLVKKQKFNPAQLNMLQMRLDILESFLDENDSCQEAKFLPGEITIMDMSCPFIDANTACILFRIGLQRYLQTTTPGKMIVVDEAHKYMIKVPGSKSLNDSLLNTVRLQRHYGARVIISTQEPTLLSDLIALCSVTIIHRFSSPEWMRAIERHVPTTDKGRGLLMDEIESLKTGTAMMYSPAAVLGRNEDRSLIMGASRMMKVSIRKRITSDGGQSVLAA